MAWTQFFQAGAESRTLAELPNFIYVKGTTNTAPFDQISSTKKQTGGYAFRTNFNSSKQYAMGLSGFSYPQIRAGWYLNHVGANGGTGAGLQGIALVVLGSLGIVPYTGVIWKAQDAMLELWTNNVKVDEASVVGSGLDSTDTWITLGIIAKADASSGWMSFYINGAKILGDVSLNTGTAFNGIYWGGGFNNNQQWLNYAYLDDLFAEGSDTGLEPDVAPTPKRFLWGIANSDVGTPQWTPSSGVINYQMVDEAPPDGATTTVSADADAETDVYGHAAVTVPIGYKVSAVIPYVHGLRVGATEQIKIGITDGVDTLEGTAQDPPATYGPIYERYETQADGVSEWDQASVNATNIRIEGTNFT